MEYLLNNIKQYLCSILDISTLRYEATLEYPKRVVNLCTVITTKVINLMIFSGLKEKSKNAKKSGKRTEAKTHLLLLLSLLLKNSLFAMIVNPAAMMSIDCYSSRRNIL